MMDHMTTSADRLASLVSALTATARDIDDDLYGLLLMESDEAPADTYAAAEAALAALLSARELIQRDMDALMTHA
jgi:hypothetical protein